MRVLHSSIYMLLINAHLYSQAWVIDSSRESKHCFHYDDSDVYGLVQFTKTRFELQVRSLTLGLRAFILIVYSNLC